MTIQPNETDGLPTVWPPVEWEPILCEIGRIVFNWNTLENTTVRILNTLIGGEEKAAIATTHMSLNAQIDAIKTLANEYLDDEELDHILHLLLVFDRFRERRNFFVHSLSVIGFSSLNPPQYQATMESYSARGRFKRHQMKVDVNILSAEAKHMYRATHYFALVHNHFSMPDNPSYINLPEKFPLPERMEKPVALVRAENA
jgi:hypothetical protein